jgi:hypothetical protein
MVMSHHNERGVALVITLFLMASLSALAVSLMFLSQTETSASRNYKTMSQARYAGEGGAHRVMNYLMSDAFVNSVAGDLGSLNTAKSPVEYNNLPVVLSNVSTSSNYPNTTVKTNFASAAQGSLAAGTASLGYVATAKLIALQPVAIYGGGTGYLQTWEITATGTVPGAVPATVQVSAVLERDITAAETYAIFATGNGCGAIDLRGNMHTDSYDSRTYSGSGAPSTSNSGGGVGTNGNLSISGSVVVKGNLDTPRTGVGACQNGAPTALTAGGSADVSGSIVPLPQAKVYPSPVAPTPWPPATGEQTNISVSTCAALLAYIAPATCTGVGTLTVTSSGSTPISMGNVSIGSHVNVIFQYGISGAPASGNINLNLNSISLGAQASIALGSNTSMVMNVKGTNVTTPIDFTGGSFSNSSYDSSKMQILYAGTGNIEMTGGSGASGTIYAPNATVTMHGNADFYGSMLARSFIDTGGASVHYDRALQSKFNMMGNFMMSSFSWKKY